MEIIMLKFTISYKNGRKEKMYQFSSKHECLNITRKKQEKKNKIK